MDVDYEYDTDENSPLVIAPKAKAKVPKAAAPLGAANANSKQDGKSIEEIYQKKSQLEHILLRPDTYIGSTEKQQLPMWIHDGDKMVYKSIDYVPGLYKIFDEILVNAADNKVRDATMDTVKVEIDVEKNLISVWNNGAGVPVEVHKEENVYVPELIFGHLLTSSNYNDTEKKITGGRNGYGAKLANIFSTEFIIETCDGKRERRYKQVFTNNMTKKGTPKITSCKASDNWTCVSFKPDLAKFGMDHLEEDTVALMRKRVYDLSGILGKGVKVLLNGSRLPVKAFQDYVELYLGPKDNSVPRIYEKVNDRWEIVISTTEGQFNQVSFVNSICTSKGGTHVNYVLDQVTKALCEKINKKNKNANVKPFMVKNHLWLFVNTNIENPAFDSQTKENLTSNRSSFGSKCELSTQFLDKVAKCGIVDNILSFANFRNNKELKKSDGAKRQRLVGIPKLDDANEAGGRNSQHCTLILTEGDSAKTLALSGLSVVGRNYYGVFPLRGKLLNVRDATAAQISDNAEIQNIKQILGLQHGKVYEDTKALRYGHLMIMTDQDHDGSHIKGLIMNFLHHFYPSLLRIPGFLVEFITPIIKASKGREKHTFYTIPEYEAWKESLGGMPRGWTIKYYKGLGTSTPAEAKEYFAALDEHQKEFIWDDDTSGEYLEMAFSKKKVEDRKRWLSSFVPGTYLDQSVDKISYADFVNKELILFSRADLERSIPCMVDGLKPGQRKILYGMFKANYKKEIKVAQLAGYVAQHSAYHHGEASLAATIVGLAQNFVGSNNINLLHPAGQFGSRLQGGKDAASPRYVFTALGALTRHLFNAADDQLLDYLNEEGQKIEPEWYMPILPMVLVNGAEGIGTGWSTYIPNYNPRDIVANLRRLMAGEEPEAMQPWYRGFQGSIVEVPTKTSGRSYQCSGIISQTSDTSLEITELPVRKWTQDYKEFLEGLIKPKDKAEAPLIVEYKDHTTDTTVHFTLELTPDKLAECTAGGLDNKFKLSTKFSTGNMMLFDKDGAIKRYDSPEAILKEFYDLRLEFYEKRRVALLQSAEAEAMRIDNKARFILAVISGDVKISNRKKADIERDLDAMGFDRLGSKKKKQQNDAENEEAEDEEEVAAAQQGTFDYLLSMQLYSLTAEKVAQLQSEAEQMEAEVARLRALTGKDMWADDLELFMQALDQWEQAEEKAALALAKQQTKARKGQAVGRKAKPAAKKKAAKKMLDSDEDDEDSDDDMDDDDDWDEAPKKKAPAPKAAKPAAAAAAPKAPLYPTKAAVAAPKPAAKAGKAAAKPAASTLTASSADTQETAGTAQPEESEPLSLAERMRALMLNKAGAKAPTAPTAPAAAARPAASGTSGKRAAAKKSEPIVLDSDSDEDIMSPSPKPKAAAKPRAAAAAKPKAAAPTVSDESKKAAPKRKPAPKKQPVISDSESEGEMTDPEDIISPGTDMYDAPSPSPAVVRKGKKAREGPSPAPKGPSAALAAAAPKPKAAAAPKAAKKAAEPAPSAAPAAAAAPAERNRRAAATTAPKRYVESDDEEDDESIELSDSDDYCPSD